jgi:hypothetical protein
VQICSCLKLGKTAAEMHEMLVRTHGSNTVFMFIPFFDREGTVHSEFASPSSND